MQWSKYGKPAKLSLLIYKQNLTVNIAMSFFISAQTRYKPNWFSSFKGETSYVSQHHRCIRFRPMQKCIKGIIITTTLRWMVKWMNKRMNKWIQNIDRSTLNLIYPTITLYIGKFRQLVTKHRVFPYINSMF